MVDLGMWLIIKESINPVYFFPSSLSKTIIFGFMASPSASVGLYPIFSATTSVIYGPTRPQVTRAAPSPILVLGDRLRYDLGVVSLVDVINMSLVCIGGSLTATVTC